jgi:serine/threonine protein kinase
MKDRELINIANSLYYEWFLCRQQFHHFSFVPPGPQHDFGEDKGCRYFVMKQLDYDLTHISSICNPVSLTTISDIGLHILNGLYDLHNIGHLFIDISPSNFMIDKGDKTSDNAAFFNVMTDKLYFIDFGLAEKFTEYMLGEIHYCIYVYAYI